MQLQLDTGRGRGCLLWVVGIVDFFLCNRIHNIRSKKHPNQNALAKYLQSVTMVHTGSNRLAKRHSECSDKPAQVCCADLPVGRKSGQSFVFCGWWLDT